MYRTSGIIASLYILFSAPSAFAQSDTWNGLARTTFDIAAATLRIPCAVLEDGTGAAIPGFSPAFALNLQLNGNALRLVQPVQAFEAVPENCLDSLVVDGNIATYSTESAETDSDSVENTNHFYTLELQATIPSDGPIDFSVLTAEERSYSPPFFDGETFAFFAGTAPYVRDFVYGDDLIAEARRVMLLGLTVLEPGRLEIECGYHDPKALLEVAGNAGGSTQFHLKPSLTAAANNNIFSINCTAFNRDINRLELSVPIVEWIVALP